MKIILKLDIPGIIFYYKENIGHVIFPLVDSEKREALKYELIITNQP